MLRLQSPHFDLGAFPPEAIEPESDVVDSPTPCIGYAIPNDRQPYFGSRSHVPIEQENYPARTRLNRQHFEQRGQPHH